MIDIQVGDQVATVVVEDFAPLNRYDATFALALRDAVIDLADRDTVKAIVLRAAADDFCPDPAPWSRPGPGGGLWTDWEQVFSGARSLYQVVCFSKKVVITEVTGSCTGGGSALVLCSDLTVAGSDARIRSPFSSHPEANLVLAALTLRLNRAKAWLLRDATLSASRALEAGLVNEVVEPDEIRACVAGMARAVTRMPLDGITMSKMLLQSVLDSHGVGREFDMAGFYAAARWRPEPPRAGETR